MNDIFTKLERPEYFDHGWHEKCERPDHCDFWRCLLIEGGVRYEIINYIRSNRCIRRPYDKIRRQECMGA